MAFLMLSLNLKIVQVLYALVINARYWFASPIAEDAP